MRSITFNQALLAVGLIGLTLLLTASFHFLLWLSLRQWVGAGPSIAAPTAAFVIGLVLAFTVIAVAVRRVRAGSDKHPVTFSELLIVVGVLGVLVALAYSVDTFLDLASAEWWSGASHDDLTAYGRFVARDTLTHLLTPWSDIWSGGPTLLSDAAILQWLAFIVPLAVGGIGIWLRRRQERTAGKSEPVRPADILTAMSLLGLMFALVGADRILSGVVGWGEVSSRIGFYPTELGLLAAGPGVPVVALGILLVRRTRSGDGFSPLLLAIGGLLGLTTCMAVHTDTALLTLVIFLFLAGFTWRHDRGADEEGRGGEGLPTGRLLAGVAGLGLVIVIVNAPDMTVSLFVLSTAWFSISGASPWAGIATLLLAFVMQLGLLGVAVRDPWQRATGIKGAEKP